MPNKWATPSLILGIAAALVFPINTILPATLGALAAVLGSLGIRRETKVIRSLIGMILGFFALMFSGFSILF